ncbi:hypothetical protein VP01_3154g1 [Puccinia sorghi]|uniref:Uncharacterized protein n=1 Tax=Puccinia sorghi TaxID=27349 RepID=A0A0L6UZ17_9BASI|nr:hypothetical protein VP01_3154g1 [Puccinia sorghi]
MECFLTAFESPTFCDHQDFFWIDGIHNELDPDRVKIIHCLCLYKFQVSIYDLGMIYRVVAKYSHIQQDLWKFAMAKQLMYLLNQKIITKNVAPILKEWARKLRGCANSNHNHNHSRLIHLQTDFRCLLGPP